jgi:endo-1,4-beta-xylanase
MLKQTGSQNGMVIRNRRRIESTGRLCVWAALLACWLSTNPMQASAQPLAEGKDKFLGCATSGNLWRYMEQYWNQVTPGNDGKWGSVEMIRGQYYWTNLDKIYNFAVHRNFPFKEHTFIWGNQQPTWIASLDSADQRAAVEKWIRLVGERYPLMAMADVVNEPIRGVPSYKNALGGDGKTGWDWVITAFEMARQYCAPGVKLILNEYNVLSSGDMTASYLRIIALLQERDLIDGIGIQGHYFEFRSSTDDAPNNYVYDINTIKSNLDRLAATGLPVYITEFDIDEKDDPDQLAQYKIYFPIFWQHPSVKGITLWGYIQSDVWTSHPYTYLLLTNGTERPALQWLRTYTAVPLMPRTVSPAAGAVQPRNPILIWHPSASATSYRVQVSPSSGFSSTAADTSVADTLVQLRPLEANRAYHWRVSATNKKGTGEYSAAAGFSTGDQISSVGAVHAPATGFRLYPNYPDPFNPATTIVFSVPVESHVLVKIVDLSGREIRTLINGRMPAGEHAVHFTAPNLNSGVYFCRITAGGFTKTEKMILVK